MADLFILSRKIMKFLKRNANCGKIFCRNFFIAMILSFTKNNTPYIYNKFIEVIAI